MKSQTSLKTVFVQRREHQERQMLEEIDDKYLLDKDTIKSLPEELPK